MRGIVGAVALLSLGLPVAASGCDPNYAEIRWGSGSARFRVEVADNAAERNRGLMFRESLPHYSGMLFVYDSPNTVSFWMKNTLIPLDMLFLDRSGTITKVHAQARPLDRTTIFGGNAVQYVLEINGGMAAQLGITKGAELRHPAIEPSLAVWPCKESG